MSGELRTRVLDRLRTPAKVLLGALLLFATWHAVPGGVPLHELANADPWWLLAGVVCCSVAQLAGCLRFHFTARRMGGPIDLSTAVSLTYVGLLLNQILLFGVAGDAVRVTRHGALLKQGSAGYGRALRVHAVDRLSGQLTVFLLFAVAAPPALTEGPLWLSMLGVAALLCVFALLLRRRLRRTLLSWFDEVRAAMLARGAPFVQLSLSSLVTFGCIAMYACAAQAMAVDLSFAQVFRIGPLVLAAMSLPFGVGGFGPREAASAALFSANALDPAQGFLVAVVYGVMSFAAALPALPLWLSAAFSRGEQPDVG